MLDPKQVADKISDLREDRIDFGAFEDWFRQESQDAELAGAVDAIEDVFSQYHYEGLRGILLFQELANAIRPFVPHLEKVSDNVFVLVTRHSERVRMAESANTTVVRKPPMPAHSVAASGTCATLHQAHQVLAAQA